MLTFPNKQILSSETVQKYTFIVEIAICQIFLYKKPIEKMCINKLRRKIVNSLFIMSITMLA